MLWQVSICLLYTSDDDDEDDDDDIDDEDGDINPKMEKAITIMGIAAGVVIIICLLYTSRCV